MFPEWSFEAQQQFENPHLEKWWYRKEVQWKITVSDTASRPSSAEGGY